MIAMHIPMHQSEHTLIHPHPASSEEVLVFKTSVRNNDQVDALRPLLELTLAGRGEWNFDLEDRDHILRVEAEGLVRERITVLLTGLGYACEELD